MASTTLTLCVPEKLKKDMGEIKGINWSEETRQFLEERIMRLKLLKKLDLLTKNSDLTEQDVIEFGRRINVGIAKKHGVTN